jgi:hypothetical protein|tara:strand:+ start:998 stop:1165 length:168 start_codon:yes stop_codon:yes gene_type:complete
VVVNSILILSAFLTAIITPLIFAATQKKEPPDSKGTEAEPECVPVKTEGTHFMKG